MGKRFIISDEERKQIMEMHQSYGYKKPINEQEENVDELSIPGMDDKVLNKIKMVVNKSGFDIDENTHWKKNEFGISFEGDVVLDLSFKNGILTLSKSEFGEGFVLDKFLKKTYTFEFNRDNIDFELRLLRDFLKRVAEIILKYQSKRDFKSQE